MEISRDFFYKSLFIIVKRKMVVKPRSNSRGNSSSVFYFRTANTIKSTIRLWKYNTSQEKGRGYALLND